MRNKFSGLKLHTCKEREQKKHWTLQSFRSFPQNSYCLTQQQEWLNRGSKTVDIPSDLSCWQSSLQTSQECILFIQEMSGVSLGVTDWPEMFISSCYMSQKQMAYSSHTVHLGGCSSQGPWPSGLTNNSRTEHWPSHFYFHILLNPLPLGPLKYILWVKIATCTNLRGSSSISMQNWWKILIYLDQRGACHLSNIAFQWGFSCIPS